VAVIKPRPLTELLALAEQREQWNRQVGEKLRQAREQAGLTQEGLARKLGVSQVYVSNVERGKGVSADQLRLFTDTIETETSEGERDVRKQRKDKAQRRTK
jgi:transcriptional regulator with XRE-family HTH domain